ncbi:MerR family transcriptional regulator [Mumia sp. zg.B53]|nr:MULTISPECIES: MerR family transcriptional regulator [unclassified Mumia]MBW9207216.1 MerR family transcriptional regulator [Mumia sp. zg.B17]MBW9210435.1 MerR family transcriptional regulator [Mumia sp. zg.B21]MBW9215057.1 MerR family transcriptional regulator [Mumia sp. zg.B53]
MRVGELAELTGVAPRMLRYYEEQGLLVPPRQDNGYRSYGEEHVERVRSIRSLIASGLPTRLVRVVLDVEALADDELSPSCTRQVAEMLHAEMRSLEDKIACLTKSRDTVERYLQRTRHGDLAGVAEPA